MITIQCTKKLAEELPVTLSDKEKMVSQPLYRWHAHLILLNRRKCVAVMNNVTRYNFIIYGLKKADFTRFDQIFLEKISENLIADGIEQSLIQKYLRHASEATFTQTSDRSIISQLNDMIYLARYDMDNNIRQIGVEELNQINRLSNQYPMSKLPQIFPRDAMQHALENLSMVNT
ncbi:DUF6933 domain-containing protein [Brevibacillus brevis]|uniref:DUF6933 domain-containing protein n=1 Tax=Brevibacillus brevis TaxID=1393 RepID=UPI000D0E36AB|nr:hypothetical protein [Brevibacillus brevis]PSJ71288.1 hypothetical protein C7J99_00285 [Brevibacillus brevis]RED28893.1 hypothetical protein DES34_107244 [Brevibacillus brevis]VEF91512.1 Uncharacterised protein [Brevibacillus brevis]